MPGNVVGNNFPKWFKIENFYTVFSVPRTWSHRMWDRVDRVTFQTLGIHFWLKITYWNNCGGRLTLQDEKNLHFQPNIWSLWTDMLLPKCLCLMFGCMSQELNLQQQHCKNLKLPQQKGLVPWPSYNTTTICEQFLVLCLYWKTNTHIIVSTFAQKTWFHFKLYENF